MVNEMTRSRLEMHDIDEEEVDSQTRADEAKIADLENQPTERVIYAVAREVKTSQQQHSVDDLQTTAELKVKVKPSSKNDKYQPLEIETNQETLGFDDDEEKNVLGTHDRGSVKMSNKNGESSSKKDPHLKSNVVEVMGYRFSRQVLGGIICVVGTLFLCPDGLMVRLVSEELEENPHNIFIIIFWKYFIFACTCLVLFVGMERQNSWQKMKSIGYIGALSGLVWGASNIMINYAFESTAIANVLVINAANPMFSAFFSRIFLKERIEWRTICAGLVAFACIIFIFYSQIGNGDVAGSFTALGSGVSFALYFVLLRIAEKVNG